MKKPSAKTRITDRMTTGAMMLALNALLTPVPAAAAAGEEREIERETEIEIERER